MTAPDPLTWFRLYSDVIDDEKLRLLAFEDRWHFVALLACKAKGILDSGDPPQLMRRKVAVKLGLDQATLDEVGRRLEEVGLIERDSLQPLAWANRQFQSDSSRDRVRKYRERLKNHEMKRRSNVSVTVQETETETEKTLVPPNGGTCPRPSAGGPVDCPVLEIVALWAEVMPELPAMEVVNDTRRKHIRMRWREWAAEGRYDSKESGLAHWRTFFLWVRKSRFLMGKTKPSGDRPTFCADLEWLTRPTNWAKVIEAKYHEGVAA